MPGSGGGAVRLDAGLQRGGAEDGVDLSRRQRRAAGRGRGLFGYDAIGQLTSVGGAGVQYLSGATYNAQGQPLELVNDSGANGLRRQYGYESNTQRLSVLRAGKTVPTPGYRS